MPAHEFGIIDRLSAKACNQYEPERYGCIKVSDSDMVPLLEELGARLSTYFHSLDRPATGLAYGGVTLIPPASLGEFRDILLSRHNPAYDALIALIGKAIEQDRFMIHFGI